jgi:hypothetical protein
VSRRILDGTIRFPIRWAVVLLGLIIFLLLSWAAFLFSGGDGSPLKNWAFALSAGVSSGVAVSLMQFILRWAEVRELDRIRGLKIKNVLVSRDDEQYYRGLIAASRERVYVLGVTASRFFDDFASFGSPKEEKKTLIKAIERGVHVRVLLPRKDFLEDRSDKNKFDISRSSIEKILGRYGSGFEVRYFNDRPIESLVIVDNDILYGPVFRGSDSKDTPTVHASVDGDMSKKYFEYFERKWDEATVDV